MKYSIYDIANRAGVSKSTVSRVLNSGSVSEKSRKAVLRVLEETGYHPNQSARTLRGAQSYVIGIIVNSADALLDASSTARLAGIMHCMYEHGYSVLFINEQQKPSGEAAPFQLLEQNIVDGLIYMQNVESESLRQAIVNHREIVYTGERILPDRGFRIYIGNYDYSKMIYEYLMSCGHRKILTVLSGTYGHIFRNRRCDAYRDACRKFGLQPEEDSFLCLEEIPKGEDPQEVILRRFRQDGYTAIFADNLTYANCLRDYFARNGLPIGPDFSIIAIERGTEQASQEKEISTVFLPDYEYGLQAAQMMLKVLEDPTQEYMDVKCKFELKKRKSVVEI